MCLTEGNLLTQHTWLKRVYSPDVWNLFSRTKPKDVKPEFNQTDFGLFQASRSWKCTLLKKDLGSPLSITTPCLAEQHSADQQPSMGERSPGLPGPQDEE